MNLLAICDLSPVNSLSHSGCFAAFAFSSFIAGHSKFELQSGSRVDADLASSSSSAVRAAAFNTCGGGGSDGGGVGDVHFKGAGGSCKLPPPSSLPPSLPPSPLPPPPWQAVNKQG